MEPKTLLHADYLDIIFDKRNKSYGGYELRKYYNRRLIKGTLLLLLAVIALSSFSLVGSDKAGIMPVRRLPHHPTIVDIQPPAKSLPKVVPAQPAPAAKPVAMQVFTVPKITDEPIAPDKQMTEVRNLIVTPGLTNLEGDSADVAPVITKKAGTGVVEIPPPPSKPVAWVEQMPEFTGDLNAYIGSHLHYPESAREINIQGNVLIRFVVNEDGSVSDAAVVRGIGGGCDEVALHMVKSMPKWKPGKQNGMAVKVLFTLPVKFVLN